MATIGRPKGTNVKWSQTVATNVLKDIESGMTLRQVAEKNLLSSSLILWKVQEDPIFAEHYARAMNLRTEADFEKLADIAFEDPERGQFGIDPAWVNLKRLQIDTVKWALSKRNPKKYGEKIQQELSGEVGLKAVLVPVLPTERKPDPLPAFEPKLLESGEE